MRELAFYAPLNSPDAAKPSGDRAIARSLLRVLSDPQRGIEARCVSGFRSLEKAGEASAQAGLIARAEAETARLIEEGRVRRWPIWVTYHNYYKAPDLIGPHVSRALGIPYVLIEASWADKRLGGPWGAFERAAQGASASADVHFHFTEHDAMTLRRKLRDGQSLVHLPPFLDLPALPDTTAGGASQFLTVAMMRARSKLASYERLAEALAFLSGDWTLTIVGDGPARGDVEALFASFGARVSFRGALAAEDVARAYAECGLYLWPGIGEAFGMAYLEAQARGLPVVAEDRAGVREVVAKGGCVAADDPRGFAERIMRLQRAEHYCAAQAVAREKIATHHLRAAAHDVLWRELDRLIGGR